MSKKYDKNLIGNISTIIKYVLITISGYIISASAAQGLNLPLSESQLAELLGIILFFIIAHIDAKYPNNLFHDVVDFHTLTKYEDNDEIIETDGKIIIKSSPENIEEVEEDEGDDTTQ